MVTLEQQLADRKREVEFLLGRNGAVTSELADLTTRYDELLEAYVALALRVTALEP